jgi:hypothetical protein
MNRGSATINVAGVGLATVTDQAVALSSVSAFQFGAGFPSVPSVVLGVFDKFPALDDVIGMGAQGSTALAGYDLRTSIGPISGSPGGIGFDPCCVIHTTLGYLTFASNFSPTGQGTFTATLSPIPEPETYALMSVGLGFAGLVARRRKAVAV